MATDYFCCAPFPIFQFFNWDMFGRRSLVAAAAEPVYINPGCENWVTVRSQWKTCPPGYKHKRVKRVAQMNTGEKNRTERRCSMLLTGESVPRVPLSTFVSYLHSTWDDE
eukprot:TRINITY_DN15543_c0_g1_i1.p1 TRINITY_DN15543_c0_g1~~TRINITY_DN15543_c0_g1_i1.p1  ORF type:complete len:110 (-),score=13.60 TRINITY_DN15543_c0_g1_i1:128-457(-)